MPEPKMADPKKILHRPITAAWVAWIEFPLETT